MKGAIGATAENVEGVDITTPVYNWSETHFIPDSAMTNAYRGKLFHATGTTNASAFKGFAAGECLFLGASGSKRADEDWEVTFRFSSSPNKTGITVGDIQGIAKKGWEYLWVTYTPTELTVAGKKYLRQIPLFAYVEKVYEESDFADLAIGT